MNRKYLERAGLGLLLLTIMSASLPSVVQADVIHKLNRINSTVFDDKVLQLCTETVGFQTRSLAEACCQLGKTCGGEFIEDRQCKTRKARCESAQIEMEKLNSAFPILSKRVSGILKSYNTLTFKKSKELRRKHKQVAIKKLLKLHARAKLQADLILANGTLFVLGANSQSDYVCALARTCEAVPVSPIATPTQGNGCGIDPISGMPIPCTTPSVTPTPPIDPCALTPGSDASQLPPICRVRHVSPTPTSTMVQVCGNDEPCPVRAISPVSSTTPIQLCGNDEPCPSQSAATGPMPIQPVSPIPTTTPIPLCGNDEPCPIRTISPVPSTTPIRLCGNDEPCRSPSRLSGPIQLQIVEEVEFTS